jgi:hypothetical protein
VTSTVAVELELATEVAVIVTVVGPGTAAGATYSTEKGCGEFRDPKPLAGERDQVTPWLSVSFVKVGKTNN